MTAQLTPAGPLPQALIPNLWLVCCQSKLHFEIFDLDGAGTKELVRDRAPLL